VEEGVGSDAGATRSTDRGAAVVSQDSCPGRKTTLIGGPPLSVFGGEKMGHHFGNAGMGRGPDSVLRPFYPFFLFLTFPFSIFHFFDNFFKIDSNLFKPKQLIL
jgi:hypothetical protein